MNRKWIVAAALGIVLGIAVAPFTHRAVLAAPASGHLQIEAVTVDESNGNGGRTPTHEVFRVDSDTGRVWQFQGPATVFDKTKGEAQFLGQKFAPVAVESIK
jgi:hypothetical protein